MTELNFKGKEFVFNHHLTVPHRPLIADAEKGIGDVDLSGNLIIQGDNLHALKALLPMYAGKVDCIFIDPPYNTGNEGWRYNDNVNAPMIREWLDNNPIGVDDGLRHDKWCAMMWPRLRLLHELLADTGVFFATIDENELYRFQQIMNEIFGKDNFICSAVVQTNPRGRTLDSHLAKTHEYVLIFAKDYMACKVNKIQKDDDAMADYRHSDENGRYRILELRNRNPVFNRSNKPNLFYPIWVNENDKTVSLEQTKHHAIEVLPRNSKNEDGCWTWGKEKFERKTDLLIGIPTANGKWRIFRKDYVPDTGAVTLAKALWIERNYNNENGKEVMGQIFGKSVFDFPKSVELVKYCVALGTDSNAIILDSFAGSGTTAHAVLGANKEDNGNRKFILVEMENYADEVTAERVRRVINGYDFVGKERTELHREKITPTKLKNWQTKSALIDDIIEKQEANFDRINKKVEDNHLIITGENDIEDRATGLGGAFTYCTLGDPIDLDRILTGDDLPDFDALGAILFHMATNQTLDTKNIRADDYYLGATDSEHVWMIYQPDQRWLKSPDAALTLTRAREIAATDTDKRHLVFAAAPFVSRKILDDENLKVEFAPLPDSLYRVVRS